MFYYPADIIFLLQFCTKLGYFSEQIYFLYFFNKLAVCISSFSLFFFLKFKKNMWDDSTWSGQQIWNHIVLSFFPRSWGLHLTYEYHSYLPCCWSKIWCVGLDIDLQGISSFMNSFWLSSWVSEYPFSFYFVPWRISSASLELRIQCSSTLCLLFFSQRVFIFSKTCFSRCVSSPDVLCHNLKAQSNVK